MTPIATLKLRSHELRIYYRLNIRRPLKLKGWRRSVRSFVSGRHYIHAIESGVWDGPDVDCIYLGLHSAVTRNSMHVIPTWGVWHHASSDILLTRDDAERIVGALLTALQQPKEEPPPLI